jgi:hypothetical protein
MNMYEVTAEQTSRFGAFSLTHLTVEIEGHESSAPDGAMPTPGRFFAYYWNSSPRVLAYAREAAGAPAMHGERRAQVTRCIDLDPSGRRPGHDHGTGLGHGPGRLDARRAPQLLRQPAAAPAGGRAGGDRRADRAAAAVRRDRYEASVDVIRDYLAEADTSVH